MIENPYQPPESELSYEPLTARSAPPLWNPDAIGNWSLLLTPLFGAVLVAKNWQALGEHRRARHASVWLYVGLPLYLFSFGLPLLGLVALAAWYFTSNRAQAKYIRERFGTNYPRRAWRGPILLTLGLIFGVVALLVFVARQMLAAGYH